MDGPMNTFSTEKNSPEHYRRLYDYRVEHIMLDAETYTKSTSVSKPPQWRQQVQYAIGHTLNDFYSLQPEVRRETPIQFLLERRWPPMGSAFPSLLSYWDIKTAIADELMRMASVNHVNDSPILLYEQWHVPVSDLKLELSMIFQLAWSSPIQGRCLRIQKFLVTANEEVITGFLHMANVFCNQAYGEPFETIEIFSLWNGQKYTYDGSSISLAESMDYVRLLAVFLEPEKAADNDFKCNDLRRAKNVGLEGRIGLM